MQLDFNELQIFQKFLYNRVDYQLFLEAMKTVYDDENYIKPLWDEFTKGHIKFLTSRNEVQVFNYFISLINEMDYKG
jgi:hypothetical protein